MGAVMAADIVVSRELKLVGRRALSGSAGAAGGARAAIPPRPAEPPKEGADERCHPAVKGIFRPSVGIERTLSPKRRS